MCVGDLRTITITFRGPVSQLSFWLSLYNNEGTVTLEDDKGHIVSTDIPYLTALTINWQWNDIRVLKITGPSLLWYSGPSNVEMFIDNIQFRVAVDLAVVDPAPEPQRANGLITDPDTLAQFGALVSAVAADSANRVVLRMKSNFVGERLKLTILNDSGQPSSSVLEDGAVGPVGGNGTSVYQLTSSEHEQGPNGIRYVPPAGGFLPQRAR
jgi:hypothetical protein